MNEAAEQKTYKFIEVVLAEEDGVVGIDLEARVGNTEDCAILPISVDEAIVLR